MPKVVKDTIVLISWPNLTVWSGDNSTAKTFNERIHHMVVWFPHPLLTESKILCLYGVLTAIKWPAMCVVGGVLRGKGISLVAPHIRTPLSKVLHLCLVDEVATGSSFALNCSPTICHLLIGGLWALIGGLWALTELCPCVQMSTRLALGLKSLHQNSS